MTQIKNFKIEAPSLPTENLYQKLGGPKNKPYRKSEEASVN